MNVNDGGDASLLTHKRVKPEKAYAKDGSLSNPTTIDNQEFQDVYSITLDGIKKDANKYHKMKENLAGVLDEFVIDKLQIYQIHANGTFLITFLSAKRVIWSIFLQW